MAKEKKQVREITSMSEDFAQWYTDVVVKAGLIGYTNRLAMQSGKTSRTNLIADSKRQG